MSEVSHFSDFDPSADPARVGDKLGLVAHKIRTEKPKELPTEVHEFIVDALKFFNIQKAHELVARLEQLIIEGNHDLVHEILIDVNKLQHSEFAQEILSGSRTRHAGPGLVLNRDIGKIGQQVLDFAED
jgi:hypothetical protein